MLNQEIGQIFNELIKLPQETEWLEFKHNNSDPQAIGEYISALSNGACLHNKSKAYLIFGIEDGSHQVVGTSFKPKQAKINNQELENWLATQLEPRIDFKIYDFLYLQKSIVVFQIDATYNTPIRFRGTAYIRVGSHKENLAKHPEKARKIWNKIPSQPFEEEIVKENLSIDEILELIDYPSYFDLLRIPLPRNTEGIIEKLLQENIIIKNNAHYNITNLGAILFAKKLESFEKLARKAVRVIVYKGNSRLETEREQMGGKGYAVGFNGLLDFIKSQLPSNELIENAFRKEVKMYPELAVRELVANAIIHQDFTISGTSPMVEIFANRIEIVNSGKPLIEINRLLDHPPRSRNEKLAKFMYRMNICEERGSGIDKVVSQCELFQLPPPDFQQGDDFMRVTLYAYKSYAEMSKKEKLWACYLHCCLKYVDKSYMTNQSLRERFGIDEKNYPMVSRLIKSAIEEQYIKEQDPDNSSKRQNRYIPFWA